MNGIDWPSPAANLLSVESEMKQILASAGVTLPTVYACSPVPMLPLPMAALVSLTITFKLDKNMEYLHAVIGQALDNCSAGSPWLSMPIIGALWTQKVRRWHDFIVLSTSLSPFICDKEIIAQLIRCCFSSFLSPSAATNYHGATTLLGHSISGKNFPSPIGPGYFYLRYCRSFHDMHFVNNMILNLVVEWTHELVAGRACSSSAARSLSGRTSLASAASTARKAASLGASLLCIAGGPLLLQVLYEETVPARLLSAGDSGGGAGPATAAARLLEGYAMAYMLVLSGSFIWGTGKTSPAYTSLFTARRARSVRMHLEFVAGGVEGKVSVGCDPATWRAYVTCLVGLVVRYAPAWILDVRRQTLMKLAGGLRGWGEGELAAAILERGGAESLELLVEFLM